MPKPPEFKPVVIIGAPRSGTNMLRDLLTSLPGVGTWPCDEINYVWRHGNAHWPDDEFLPEHASPHVQSYVRRAFSTLARRTQSEWIVEKTCANSLRVRFVDRILPDAKYIFLVRDGRDAVASAMQRWTAPMEWKYVVRKARYVPAVDLPRYASAYAINRMRRLLSAERRLASWGPTFWGMQELLANGSLATVCATQWERCVARARKDLADLESTRVILIKYEHFVSRPLGELQRLLEFLGIEASADAQQSATKRISDRSVGKWRSALDGETLAQISPMLDRQLVELGYEPCRPRALAEHAA